MTCEDLGPYRKAGRPRQSFCKRGHPYVTGVKCIRCKSIREAAWYDAHKESKKAYMQQWRADFRLAFGVPYQTLYSRGLTKKDVI
jgi:hypothetical protein